MHVYEQTWRQPAVTVIAQEASSIKQASNQVLPRARAIVSCRIVPDQRPDEVFEQLKAVLTKDPPWGVKVEVKQTGSVEWWMTSPEGPAFEAALEAMQKGFDHKPAMIGCGGTIGFVGPLGETVRRGAGAAAGHRRSAEQRPRAEREPARGRLEGADALAGASVRQSRGAAGRQGEVAPTRTKHDH